MFGVLALAGLALSATSEVAGHIAQGKASAANRKAAAKDFRATAADISARRSEEGEATRLDLSIARTASLVEQGMAALTLAEAGNNSNTARMVQSTTERGLSDYTLTALENLRLTNRQLDRNLDQARTGMRNRVAAVPAPSGLATGLRLGGAGLSYANRLASQRER